MIKKHILILLISILAIATVLYFALVSGNDEAKGKNKNNKSFSNLVGNLEGLIVKTSALEENIEVSGTIIPYDETIIMSEVSGKIVNINLAEGKLVKKGTLLLKLFDEDLQAQLKMFEVQLEIAKNNEQRMKTLFNVKGTSQQEYDASLLQVSNLKAQIEILKVNIGKTEIKAPYDGMLGLKKISVGQYITPATQIVTIRAVNKLKIDFSIPERYGSKMIDGSKIIFTVSGNDKIFEASVIANESSIESDSRNLKVRAIISDKLDGLIPGAFAKVTVNLGNTDKALMIPTSAIIPEANTKKVFVVKNGIAKYVVIKTGVRRADAIEVLSGLNEGDTIIVSGILFVKPKSSIKFSKVS
ncbi:MAG TPA: efflux RND transporter periplasmic adaptor subunit [Candidatus Kapabacteria bacterium]|nr:efflux RND transporter periplasmic adaptor subunit [Candidatus Kapabacteria bacterium]